MSGPLSVPKFSSAALQSAIDDAREVIENIDRDRNRVSNDIKVFETYLNEAGIKETFRHGFGRAFVALSGSQLLQETGGADGEFHEDALVWAPDQKGRFRLFYEHSKWQGCIEVDADGGPDFCSESSLVRDSKRLIETSFEIRKQMHGRLPAFVRALSAHLSIDEAKPDESDPDSVPF